MTLFFVLIVNLILYWYVKISLLKKFRNSYTITLKDKEGNVQTLADTIAFLIERDDFNEKRIMYLAKEMESQWTDIELIKGVVNLPDPTTPGPTEQFLKKYEN